MSFSRPMILTPLRVVSMGVTLLPSGTFAALKLVRGMSKTCSRILLVSIVTLKVLTFSSRIVIALVDTGGNSLVITPRGRVLKSIMPMGKLSTVSAISVETATLTVLGSKRILRKPSLYASGAFIKLTVVGRVIIFFIGIVTVISSELLSTYFIGSPLSP